LAVPFARGKTRLKSTAANSISITVLPKAATKLLLGTGVSGNAVNIITKQPSQESIQLAVTAAHLFLIWTSKASFSFLFENHVNTSKTFIVFFFTKQLL